VQADDLRAQKRLEFALMLEERGDLEAAVSLFEETLALAPDWDEAHFAFANVLEKAGWAAEAIDHFTAYLRLAASDDMGAEVRLALLGGLPVPPTLPEAYVKTLFDQYATRFESALLGDLDYRAPFQLREAVERLRATPVTGERILDLGCGTGLAGEAFRDRAAWLAGIDLSPGMIAEANRKTIYNELREGEIVAALIGGGAAYDLVVAADVLVYIGDLAPLFRALKSALQPDGLFAFSVQQTDADDFALGAECRYSHSPAYLKRLARETGFEPLTLEATFCRREAGEKVPSLICVFRRMVDAVPSLLTPMAEPQDTPAPPRPELS
jgi:predicted TPR repeat methyltransferase